MASSRLEKIGNIYTRVKGLLRSGAMKPEDKPIWYEVYEAFPPKVEPQFNRKAPDINIRQILYPEDIIRAKFYQKYGSPGTVSLFDSKHPTPCQRFVNKYREMEKDYSDENELFDAVAKAYEEDKLAAAEAAAVKQADTQNSMASMFSSAVRKQNTNKPNAEELLKE